MFIFIFFSLRPTKVPSNIPTFTPTLVPTVIPSVIPTLVPSATPSKAPTFIPSKAPTFIPTKAPTFIPSEVPTLTPSEAPTLTPSKAPTFIPSKAPTFIPSKAPTFIPTEAPTFIPSEVPTLIPSEAPTLIPSDVPSSVLPSSQPTSIPSSGPTTINLILINTLSTRIDTKLVVEKSKFYLGYYIGYFFILFTVLLIIDKSKCGKGYFDKLLKSAHDSNVYNPGTENYFDNFTVREKDALILTDLFKKDQSIIHVLEEECITNELDKQSLCKHNKVHQVYHNDVENEKFTENSRTFSHKLVTPTDDIKIKFSAAFYEYILQRRTYIGCEPIIYENGYVKSFICCSWCLPAGAYEDFLIYVANNHPLLSCIYAAKGGPLSRSGRRLVYTMQYSLAFFIKILSFGIFQYFDIPEYVSPVFSILVITPLSVSFGTFIKLLYTCSCLVSNNQFRIDHPKMYRRLKLIGRMIAIPFILLVLGLLVLASTFSCQSSRYDVILSFFLQVQVISSVLEVVYAVLVFTPDYYFNLSIVTPIFSKTLVLIGSLYVERLVKFMQKPVSSSSISENRLFINTRTYFGGIFRSETLCSRAYALKKGWITEIQADSVDENHQPTIEIVECMENPMLQLNRMKSISSITISSPPPPPPPLVKDNLRNQLGINNVPTDTMTVKSEKLSSEDDINSLYQSYLKEVSLNELNQLSFDEWKLSRKKFKENTRLSFIGAYNRIADHLESRTNIRLREQFFQRTNPLIHRQSNMITTVDTSEASDDVGTHNLL